jgi:hypothetical protein
MNKKGMLLGEETLKVIIAVISITFLIFFLVSLYLSSTRNKDLEMAEASLEHLITEINAGRTEVEIYNPIGGFEEGVIEGIKGKFKNWFILSWSSEKFLPDSCISAGWDKCICICEGGLNKGEEIFAKRCDEEGTCLENEFFIEARSGIKIENPPLVLTIDQENKLITKREI